MDIDETLVLKPVSPTTTAEEDRHTASQRTMDLSKELTQALVAMSVTLAVIYCAVWNITSSELTNAFFLIIGFYFGRTNHERLGGLVRRQ